MTHSCSSFLSWALPLLLRVFRFYTINLIPTDCFFLVLARLETESVGDDQRLLGVGPRPQPYCQSAARTNRFTFVADRAVVMGSSSCTETPAKLTCLTGAAALLPTIGRVVETSRCCGPHPMNPCQKKQSELEVSV